MARKFTFVVIGFEGDAGLLHLQARSMRLYCPPDFVEEIIIVDNSTSSESRWRRTLVRQYGALADAVRIIPAATVSSIPEGTVGWFSQQILKLKVADAVKADRYVLLDAKNHLISTLDCGFLETPSGKPRNYCRSYEGHVMLEYFESTLKYLGMDPESHKLSFPRTHPPFTIFTSEARELVQLIEQRENRSFASVFVDQRLSEFFLYSAFLISKGLLHSLYDMTQPNEPQIWPGNAKAEGCRAAISRATQDGCPFMSVHRRALENMDKPGRALLAQFWHQRSLFASPKDAMRFLRNPARCCQRPNGQVIPWPLSSIMS